MVPSSDSAPIIKTPPALWVSQPQHLGPIAKAGKGTAENSGIPNQGIIPGEPPVRLTSSSSTSED